MGFPPSEDTFLPLTLPADPPSTTEHFLYIPHHPSNIQSLRNHSTRALPLTSYSTSPPHQPVKSEQHNSFITQYTQKHTPPSNTLNHTTLHHPIHSTTQPSTIQHPQQIITMFSMTQPSTTEYTQKHCPPQSTILSTRQPLTTQ